MLLSGVEILIKCLKDHNVDTIFGYPGSCVIQILDNLYEDNEIKHILVRHEQGAVHAASGYAQLANKPGVVLVTSGPGATNTTTGIANAYYNGIPLIVFTGQVSSYLLGTDAFQEADVINITATITKWNYQITKADQIVNAVKRAFKIAIADCPGPVLLDITKDAQTGMSEYNFKKSDELYSSSISKKSTIYEEVMQMLRKLGKEIVFVIDKVPNDFYPDEYFRFNKVLKSEIFKVPGFGLPTAIGATFANRNKSVCLIAGDLEFQAAIKELGVIKQYGLNVKMIIFNNYNKNKIKVIPPDFVLFIKAYEIKGEKVNKKKDLYQAIQRLLNSTESYLLEINVELIEDS